MRDAGNERKHRASMRRCALILVAALVLLSAPIAVFADPLTKTERTWLQEKGTIIFVSQTTYPPFEFVNDRGNPQGMCIELARWMSTELGFKASFQYMTFKEAQEAVLLGKADVLTSLFYSKERDLRFDFSEMTWEVPALIFVRAERPDITKLEDLQGKRIAIQRGDYAVEYLKSKHIEYNLVPTATFAEATDKVIAGEADAVIGNQQIVLYHLFSNDLADRVKSVGEPLYIGRNCMGVREGRRELVGILNKGLALARERGIFEGIADKWVGTHYAPHFTWLQQHARHLAIALVVAAVFSAMVVVWSIHLRKAVARRTIELLESRDALRPIARDVIRRSSLKTWILVLAALIPLCVGGDYVLRHSLILPSYRSLERLEAEKTVSGCVDAIKREMNHLGEIAGAWAMWDDTYQFVEDGNAAYIRSNFQWESLLRSVIHTVYVINLEGKIVWGGTYDPVRGSEIELDGFPRDLFPKNHPLLRHESPDDIITGVVLTEIGPMLIISRPIVTSVGKGPSRGVIVMGRFLLEKTIRELSKQMGVRFSVKDPRSSQLDEQEREILAKLSPERQMIEEADDDVLKGYGVLADVDGKPALLISVTLSREIMQRGRASARVVSIVILASVVLIAVFLYAHFLTSVAEVFRRQEHIEALVEQRTSALQESEARYRAFFEEGPDGVVVLNPETGQVVEFNNQVCQQLGYTRDEFAQLLLDDIEASKTPAEIRAHLEKVVREGRDDFETKQRTKQGEIRHVQVTAQNIDVGERSFYHCIWRDITERHRTEEALRTSEERYRDLFTGSRDGIVVVDAEGRFLDANPAYCRMLGYSLEELRDLKGFLSITPEKWHSWELEEIWNRRLMQEGHSGIYEIEYIRKDGTIFPVELQTFAVLDRSGNPKYLWGVVRDITERKHAEQTIQAHAERIKTIFSSINDAIFVHPFQHEGFAPFIEVNDIAVQRYGYSRDEFLGLSAMNITKKTDTEKHATPGFRKNLLDEGRMFFETVHIKKSGEEFPVEINSNIIEQDGQKLIVAVVRDITERKQAEEERQRLEAQLLQAQKLEAVGGLAGGVAHDFNNMLSVILGHSELILADISPGERYYHDVMEIQKAARRSAALTRQLLTFARRETISPKILDLNETASGMLKMLHRLIGENIHLAWVPGPNVWPVKMDPGQIDQILANLAVNSRDAIGGAGTLTIETTNVVLDESYCRTHDGVKPGDYVMLAVHDTGAGMDREILDRIFEPFYTTKEPGKGTGLGLATVYGIVKQNNGIINVDSEPGCGTAFKIYFPRAEEGLQEITAPVAARDLKGTETVLLVEDEQSILALGSSILKRHGYVVLAAHSPTEALKMARSHVGPIHLLITDVVMPEMNGKDLKEQLNAVKPGFKCIFMSGYTADIIAHHGILDDGIDFLQKPFSVAVLANKVRDVLDS